MSKKEEKSKEYARQYDEYDWQLVAETAYEAGWDDALKSQWVSVEEKMPEIWKDVLVFIIRDTDVQIHKSTYFGEKDWSFGGIKIIAWMPIPSFEDILEANKDVLERLKGE